MSQDYSMPWRTPHIREFAKSAGVPSRYNIWEYDYPDSGGSNSTSSAPSTSTLKQEESPGLPAFARDAVYSPMGDFYGNFPDTSGAGKSPAAFTPSRSDVAPDTNSSVSFFSQLMSRGQLAGAGPSLPANASSGPLAGRAAAPLQPANTSEPADGRPERFLGKRTYDPSQGPPFPARPAPSPAPPDGSLSLNDAYLEYLRRLNAYQSPDAAN
jgi:hypothetical protein